MSSQAANPGKAIPNVTPSGFGFNFLFYVYSNTIPSGLYRSRMLLSDAAVLARLANRRSDTLLFYEPLMKAYANLQIPKGWH